MNHRVVWFALLHNQLTVDLGHDNITLRHTFNGLLLYILLRHTSLNYLSADIQTSEFIMYYLFSKRSLALHNDGEAGLER